MSVCNFPRGPPPVIHFPNVFQCLSFPLSFSVSFPLGNLSYSTGSERRRRRRENIETQRRQRKTCISLELRETNPPLPLPLPFLLPSPAPGSIGATQSTWEVCGCVTAEGEEAAAGGKPSYRRDFSAASTSCTSQRATDAPSPAANRSRGPGSPPPPPPSPPPPRSRAVLVFRLPFFPVKVATWENGERRGEGEEQEQEEGG